jgi:hypothetical protein
MSDLFVVCTKQKDGSWLADWDNEVHTSEDDGRAALKEAHDMLGAGVGLFRLIPVEVIE